jgi:glycosyltransferase involved in cell wall biosynthesis
MTDRAALPPLMSGVPKISIVMPVRDAAGTLPMVLKSIRGQTTADWELLAVDDGSKDETRLVLESAARADARIRVLSQAALGIAEALQRGCAAARGEAIARMDADDWMAPERLRRQLQFLECHPQIGVVSCRVRHGGDQTAQAGYEAHVAWTNSLLTPDAIALRRFVESPVVHPSVMFRRQLLQRHGGYASGDFPEDYELWLRWMDAGVRFGKLDAELLIWNDPPARLSRTEPRYRTSAFYRTKCVYLARWLKQQVEPSREIWLWGAGRITRRRFRTINTAGIAISGFIDVDVKKLGRLRDGRPVVAPCILPSRDRAFILAGVATRGARDLIGAELKARARTEGSDYLLVA